MTRDMRFRFVGVFFYVVLLFSLALTKSGMDFLRNLLSGDSTVQRLQILISLAGLGALLFTSDAMGYLFGTAFHWIWERHGGWSQLWSHLRLRATFVDVHNRRHTHGHRPPRTTACQRLSMLPEDLYFSYFWQRVPQGRREWAMRRHLSFLTDSSIVVALVCAFATATAVHLFLARWDNSPFPYLGLGCMALALLCAMPMTRFLRSLCYRLYVAVNDLNACLEDENGRARDAARVLIAFLRLLALIALSVVVFCVLLLPGLAVLLCRGVDRTCKVLCEVLMAQGEPDIERNVRSRLRCMALWIVASLQFAVLSRGDWQYEEWHSALLILVLVSVLFVLLFLWDAERNLRENRQFVDLTLSGVPAPCVLDALKTIERRLRMDRKDPTNGGAPESDWL
jgi:hypothetical protein